METGRADCTECHLGKFLYVDDVPYDLARKHNSPLDCLVCDQNSYMDERGWHQRSCKICPSGKIISDPGEFTNEHLSKENCIDPGIICPSSQYRNDDGCSDCGINYYCDGVTRFLCNYGEYCPGGGVAESCKVGTYGDAQGQGSEQEACRNCTKGK